MSDDKKFDFKDENITSALQEAVSEDKPKEKKTNKGGFFDNFLTGVATVFTTLGRWIKRMFCGASKDLVKKDALSVEDLSSPTKLAVKSFFRRKLAVAALVVLVLMFVFVFLGSAIIPIEYKSDALQANMSPVLSMRSVPKQLKNNVKSISGYSGFTIGVSKDNTMYIWGATKDNLTKYNYKNFPSAIQKNKVVEASAGLDHIVAITTDGKVVAWGNNFNGQYGRNFKEDDPVVMMPEELISGTIDATKVDQLLCGYQVTALVVDGKLYVWGNTNSITNLVEVSSQNYTNVKKVAISNSKIVVLFNDGTISTADNTFNRQSAYSSITGERVKHFTTYIEDKKVVDVAATDYCFAILLEDGELLVNGSFEKNENKIPKIAEDDKYVKVVAGTKHFVALTEKGKAYSWGDNFNNQSKFKGESADDIFAGSRQTYLAKNSKIVKSCGLKGYIFGTDNLGRDVFTRIVHGGKMTMTIGAVAVIISTVIAVIVGCVSGYFGGWVDMLLMRITEIVSAIPFLPFAMLLSYIMQYMTLTENQRIFIIMVILGVLSWTGLARMVRGQVLVEREKDFTLAAKAMGVRESKIAFKHILPNVISIILVSVTLDFAGCMLTESSLSYLGFGVQQPKPTWGNMLNGCNSIVIQNYWWRWVFPAIFLAVATICINIIGDTLRDVLDPKSSQDR